MDVVIEPAGPDLAAEVTSVRDRFLAEHHGRHDPDLRPDAGFHAAHLRFTSDALARGDLRAWLARSGGTTVGGVSLLTYRRPPRYLDTATTEGWVFALWVDRAHRRAGLGRRLMDALHAGAEGLGIHRLFLFATDDGRPLYDELGYRHDARLLLRDAGDRGC